MLPISFVYLEREDLYHLPKNPDKLLTLLNLRYERWCIRNQWRFPSTFSFRDLELGDGLQTKRDNTECYEALRVAGNQQQIAGSAVLFEPALALDKLPTNSILIADNLLPEQIIACQQIRGIILRKGSYLSHTSIIAREKNIAIIAQYPIEKISSNDTLLIHSGNQITIIKNKVLDWCFLDRSADDSEIGNKAQRLAILGQKGFKLPESIILKHKDVQNIYELACIQSVLNEEQSKLWQDYYDDLKQLFRLFNLNKSPLILRSSTNKEDSSDYSYAGLFYSEAGISNVDELISAIGTSWQKMLASIPVIKKYSGENAKLALNLIVQQYISSQFGGVLFTESTLSGRMHVEISASGAEGVAQGDELLASLHIDENGLPITTNKKQILSTKQYQVLYQLGRDIATLFGAAQDIEWLLSEGEFYIIQSRDITHAVDTRKTSFSESKSIDF